MSAKIPIVQIRDVAVITKHWVDKFYQPPDEYESKRMCREIIKVVNSRWDERYRHQHLSEFIYHIVRTHKYG